MKKIRLVAVGLLLSAVLVGCNSVDKAKEVIEHVQTLKDKGCDALSEPAKAVLVAVIKSQFESYPPNGICNPVWVQDVLLEKLNLQGEFNVQNKPVALGYKANFRDRHVDQPSRVGLLLGVITTRNNRPFRLQNRLSVNTQDGKMVYSSIVASNQGGSGYT
ncbi:hypothetical protein WN093_12120 [Gammaproteobacteria bacterium AS21]